MAGTYIEQPDYSKEKTSWVNFGEIRGFTNTIARMPDLAMNNVFLGVPNLTQNTLAYMEPWIGGYGKVFCLQAPIFFNQALRATTSRAIERYCKGLSGLSNYELQTVEIQYGNNAESFAVPTGIKKGNNTFNLKFTELKHGFFRHIFKYWVTGMADLGSGYATYHGRIWEDGLMYSAINHTAIILYALTDNSGGGYGLTSLEFACLWFGAFPTTVPNGHFEYEQGSHNSFDLDEPFQGIYHENNMINAFAAELLLKSRFYKDNYNDFNMGSLVWDGFNTRNDGDGNDTATTIGFEPFQADATQFADLITPSGLSADNYTGSRAD